MHSPLSEPDPKGRPGGRPFTIEEADALLPQLKALFAQIQAARAEILAAQPNVWPALEKSALDGGNAAAGALMLQFERIKRHVREVQALGVEVKDLSLGLVDFPSERDGRPIYLCWRYDENRVAYWHEIESGFAGRQPL